MVKTITAYRHTCLRCDHTWTSESKAPIRCGKCKSPYWQSRRLCKRCQTELTSADREAGKCTQCELQL